jgi:hypothetical protein
MQKLRIHPHFGGEGFAGQEITAGVIRDGQEIAVLTISKQEPAPPVFHFRNKADSSN